LLCPTPTASRPYERHRPETTVLHLVVGEHLETFLATVREELGKDLPRYVEQELRRYLRCGILPHASVASSALIVSRSSSSRIRVRPRGVPVVFGPPDVRCGLAVVREAAVQLGAHVAPGGWEDRVPAS
jgi:hypothetical protein